MASVEVLGGGCGGPAPVLSGDAPVIGSVANLTVTSVFPNAPTTIWASMGAPQPISVPVAGGQICTIHVDVFNPSNFVLWFSGNTDPNGTFTVAVPVPNEPALDGMVWTLQSRIWAPGGPIMQGDHLANAIRITVGCH